MGDNLRKRLAALTLVRATAGRAVEESGVGGPNRTGRGLPPTDFRTSYGFHRRPVRGGGAFAVSSALYALLVQKSSLV
jgi:hypothetical protein